MFWRGYSGSWEALSLQKWRELASKVDCILDVAPTPAFLPSLARLSISKGVGDQAVPSRLCALAAKYCFECSRIIAEQVAASDRSGTATFYDFPGEHQYSASLEAAMGGKIPTTVQVETLDALVEKHDLKRVDLIKIDVERHELAALRGFRKTLERDRPTILIEVLDSQVKGGIAEALAGLPFDWTLIPDEEGRTIC